ncbi:hypothetical protein VTN77DRAFT_2094 [Rasamsonia byssochlamydoides]|uniref:uncharacterized protein n=1 Tax=Rasamsonia byssochlamydoides TaxID=89139 RepID=UPI003741F7B6
MNTTSRPNIKTRFLIISDTHGVEFRLEAKPLKHADVAIQCGDLTNESKIEEYRATIRLLEDIDAPLKLVIAGNHDFTMVDVVVTHGPPKGILDYTESGQRAGCSNLFAAVARARPRLHCFGHIHEGWGAKLVTWRDRLSETPSHFADIDNWRSVVVETLSGLKKSMFDMKTVEYYTHERCYATGHCAGDANPLEWGAQTLFVNAAIGGNEDHPVQMPWLIDIELPGAEKKLTLELSPATLPKSQPAQ